MEMRVAGVTNDVLGWALPTAHKQEASAIDEYGDPPPQVEGRVKGAHHCVGGQGCDLGCKVQEVIGGKGN